MMEKIRFGWGYVKGQAGLGVEWGWLWQGTGRVLVRTPEIP